MRRLLTVALLALAPALAVAAEPPTFTLTLRNHRFVPAQLSCRPTPRSSC